MPNDRFYASPVWRALRQRALERDGHACADCGRRASHVHHRIPRSKGGPDALHNLISLCHGCHSSETCRSDGGFGNAKSRKVAIGPDGWPIER